MGFTFSYDFSRSSLLTIHSLEEFSSVLKTIDINSIQYHIERGDFERWLSQVVGDEKLADQIAKVNQSNRKLKGEALRKKVFTITNRRLIQLMKTSDGQSRTLKKNRT